MVFSRDLTFSTGGVTSVFVSSIVSQINLSSLGLVMSLPKNDLNDCRWTFDWVSVFLGWYVLHVMFLMFIVGIPWLKCNMPVSQQWEQDGNMSTCQKRIGSSKHVKTFATRDGCKKENKYVFHWNSSWGLQQFFVEEVLEAEQRMYRDERCGCGRVVKGETGPIRLTILKTKPSPKSVSCCFRSSYVVCNSLCYLATESDCMLLCSCKNCIKRRVRTHLSSFF